MAETKLILMTCSDPSLDHVWMFVLYPMQYVRYTTAKPFEIQWDRIEVLILIIMEHSTVCNNNFHLPYIYLRPGIISDTVLIDIHLYS